MEKELGPILRDHPVFAELLPKAAARAAEVGHEYLDNYHCFSVLLRKYADSPLVAKALAGRSAEELERTIWKVVKAADPIPAVSALAPRMWYMVHSVCVDAAELGIPVSLFSIVMFFLTRKTGLADSVYEILDINKSDVILRLLEHADASRRPLMRKYYLELAALLEYVVEQRWDSAREVWPTGEGGVYR